MIELTIPGEPMTWKRAGSRGAHRFTLTDMQTRKDEIAMIGRLACKTMYPADTPLVVSIQAAMKAPQRLNLAKTPRPMKSDTDNIAKLILDALEGVVYENDKQVVDLHVSKHWATEGRACTVVKIHEW